jgi:hypothetical protein
MLQSRPQSRQKHAGGNPAWVRGMASPYPCGAESVAARRARHRSMMEGIASSVGYTVDSMPPGDAILLAEACWLLMSKPRSHYDRVRAINAANRLIEGLRQRYAPKRQPTDPYLVTLLDPQDRPQTSAPEPFESEGDDHASEPERGNRETSADEEPLERRVERARVGDVVRIGNVEVEIVGDDDDEAAL